MRELRRAGENKWGAAGGFPAGGGVCAFSAKHGKVRKTLLHVDTLICFFGTIWAFAARGTRCKHRGETVARRGDVTVKEVDQDGTGAGISQQEGPGPHTEAGSITQS